MWKIVSVETMQAVEREADASGLTYDQMMQNAGRNLAEVVHAQEGTPAGKRAILALVGPGNNGGDALVALKDLAGWGWQVSAYLLRPRPDDPLVAGVLAAGGDVAVFGEDDGMVFLSRQVARAHVLLDGLLGTGTRLPLRGDTAQLLAETARLVGLSVAPTKILAVDCPSGVDCDSGECAEETLRADLTITMAAVKKGLLKFPAATRTRKLHLVGIGALDGLAAWDQIKDTLVDSGFVRAHLPDRPLDAHKGTFGTALICAGSLNYSGAAWLAGQAAYRAGAGMVTLAVPQPLHAALAGQFPEATWLLMPHANGFLSAEGVEMLTRSLGRATALLLGPGWGLEDTTRSFLEGLLKADLPPLVIDADGLKLLASIPDWPARLRHTAVLTPHPGEMAVLTGQAKEAQADRIEYARSFAQQWGHVIVLKGAYTVVAAPTGETGVIPFASPALARAGTGDVLAGLITGLLAQGLAPFDAAVCGAWIHGRAGVLAAQQAGGNSASVLAGDVLAAVRQAAPTGKIDS